MMGDWEGYPILPNGCTTSQVRAGGTMEYRHTSIQVPGQDGGGGYLHPRSGQGGTPIQVTGQDRLPHPGEIPGQDRGMGYQGHPPSR